MNTVLINLTCSLKKGRDMLIREKEFIISAFVTKVACFNTNKSCSVNIFLSNVRYFKGV